jgi:uncharacterized protein (TIGR02118 family)
MILVSVMNPAGPSFDMGYYLGHHMPLVRERWSSLGLHDAKVIKGTGTPDGGAAPFQVMALLTFESVDAFKKAYQAEFGAPPQAISGEGYDAVRWLARAATIAGTVDSATKIRAAMPEALGAGRNMFNMANLDDKGDIDFPMYVGVIAGGAVSVFTGDR